MTLKQVELIQSKCCDLAEKCVDEALNLEKDQLGMLALIGSLLCEIIIDNKTKE